MNRTRSGFTIVELLIVAVLGSMVVAAAYQVLITNQRTYTAQNAQIQSQQTVRAGVDVLFGELRELSRTGLDIQGFGTDTLKVRAMRKFGLACAVNVAAGTIDVKKYGSWIEVGDSVVVYAENTTSSASDDDWIKGRVSTRDTTIACGGTQAQRLTIPAIATAASMALASARDTVRVGANVRTYTHYTYGLYTVDGAPYLGRRDTGSSVTTALVGPLKASTGLAFRYLDTLNAVTTTLANIAQIEVTLRTTSTIRGPNGGYVADSIKTRIALRN
jgi:prepilin-type N-terminal cleavage/methylation domain-containing protein